MFIRKYALGQLVRDDVNLSIRTETRHVNPMSSSLSRKVEEDAMITCFIHYEIDPFKKAEFEQYARNWGQAIPRCGADLVGYYAPHEGSATTGYAIYNIENLAAYEAYRARLAADPAGRENYEFAVRERFIRREDRVFLKLVSMPHAPLVKP